MQICWPYVYIKQSFAACWRDGEIAVHFVHEGLCGHHFSEVLEIGSGKRLTTSLTTSLTTTCVHSAALTMSNSTGVAIQTTGMTRIHLGSRPSTIHNAAELLKSKLFESGRNFNPATLEREYESQEIHYQKATLPGHIQKPLRLRPKLRATADCEKVRSRSRCSGIFLQTRRSGSPRNQVRSDCYCEKITMKPLGKVERTDRGFECILFKDSLGENCRLQQSSLAEYEKPGTSAVWIGSADADPRIMASQARSFGINTNETTGWVPYTLIPKEVLLHTECHLDRTQVTALIAHLQNWLDNDTFKLKGQS